MAITKYGTTQDYNFNQITRVLFECLSSAPALASTLEGRVWWNTTTKRLEIQHTTNSIQKQFAFVGDAHTHSLTDITGLNGAVSTILSSNLTSNMVMISDSNGKAAASTISVSKLNFLTDVTSNIQAQFTGKIDSSKIGAINGVASLGADGKVPTSQIPGSVDDVVEATDLAALNALPTAEKMSNRIYVALDTNIPYRYSGTQFVSIAGGGVVIGSMTPNSVGTTASVGSTGSAADAGHIHELLNDVVVTAKIKNNNVTNAKLATVPSKTIKGNLAAVAANTNDISVSDLADELVIMNSSVGAITQHTNSSITVTSGGEAVWDVVNLNAIRKFGGYYTCNVQLYETTTWNQFEVQVSINQTTGMLTLKWNATPSSTIAAGLYMAVVIQ